MLHYLVTRFRSAHSRCAPLYRRLLNVGQVVVTLNAFVPRARANPTQAGGAAVTDSHDSGGSVTCAAQEREGPGLPKGFPASRHLSLVRFTDSQASGLLRHF